MHPLDHYLLVNILRDRVRIADTKTDPDKLARIFREIEKLAADAARKIERAQLEDAE